MNKISVYPDHKVITYSVKRPHLATTVRNDAIKAGFEEKTEYHVTLIPSKYGAKMTNEQFNICSQLLQNLDVNDIKVSQEIFYIKNPKIVDNVSYPRQSLISPVRSAQLLQAIAKAVRAIGLPLTPYLHVTLFTKGDNKYARTGIGIEDAEEFSRILVSKFE